MKKHTFVVAVVSIAILGIHHDGLAEGGVKKIGPKYDKGSIIEIEGADKIDPKMAKPADSSIDPKMQISLPTALDLVERSKDSPKKACPLCALAESLRYRDPEIHDLKAAIHEAEHMSQAAEKSGNLKDQNLANDQLKVFKAELRELQKQKKEQQSVRQACPTCALSALNSGRPATKTDFDEALKLVDQRISDHQRDSLNNKDKSVAAKIAELVAIRQLLSEKSSKGLQSLDPNAMINKAGQSTPVANPASAKQKAKSIQNEIVSPDASGKNSLPKAASALEDKL